LIGTDRSLTFSCEKKKQKRVKWTQEELKELEGGMKKFGTNWSLILSMSSGPLSNRTAVQLKDKARNEKRRREREGTPLGVFQKATG
jgi:Myb-like DNA-binding domain